MEHARNIRLRLLSYIVIAYMLLAFIWWSVLLYEKNKDAFYAKRELLLIGMVAEGRVSSSSEFYQTATYLELKDKYQTQTSMILGEAGVFVCSLLIGLYLINRSYHKEMMAARQRRNFLLSITHELKSPIASIQLILETMQKRGTIKQEIKERLLNNALNDTKRLNGLVSNLLLSAKLESAYQPHRENLDLAELIEDILDKLRHKHPTFKFSYIQDGNIPIIHADRTGMTSVAINLLENAIKYSTGSTEIQTYLSFVKDQIILKIADNGIGIDDKEKKKIFEKFYRIGNEDTRKTKGTGLGLYIVAEIIKAHQGRINVLDNKPHGTIFSIQLPVKNKAAEPFDISRRAS